MKDYIQAAITYGSQAKAALALGINKRSFERGLKNQRKREAIRESRAVQTNEFIKPVALNASVTFKPMALTVKPKRILYFTDTHDEPALPKDRFAWIGYWAKHGNFDHVINGGDVADLQSLLTHVGNETYGGRFKGTIQEDFASLKQALELFKDASGGKFVEITLGNHDWRPWTFADRNPEAWGFIQHAFLDIFKSVGWATHDYGARITREGVDFIHNAFQKGTQKPMGGETVMQRYSKRIVRSVCFGHNHMYGVYSEAKDDGLGGEVTIINGGCSLPQGFIPSYTKGAPTGWKYGINELTVLDGVIIGHRFVSMIESQAEYEARNG